MHLSNEFSLYVIHVIARTKMQSVYKKTLHVDEEHRLSSKKIAY